MKNLTKTVLCIFIAVIAMIFLSVPLISFAKDKDPAKEPVKKEKALSPEERNKLENKAKEELNGTAWQIHLSEMVSGDNTKAKKDEKDDTVYFEDFRIRVAGMAGDGFNPTNYSIRIKGKDNETIVWETMQTSEDEAKGVAFWRGQFEKGSRSMKGVLSWQIDENKKTDYSFRGAQKEIVPEVKPQPVAEVAAPAAAPTEAAVEAVEEERPAASLGFAERRAPRGEPAEAVKEVKPPVQAEAVREVQKPVQEEAVKEVPVEQKAARQEVQPRPKWMFWKK